MKLIVGLGEEARVWRRGGWAGWSGTIFVGLNFFYMASKIDRARGDNALLKRHL